MFERRNACNFEISKSHICVLDSELQFEAHPHKWHEFWTWFIFVSRCQWRILSSWPAIFFSHCSIHRNLSRPPQLLLPPPLPPLQQWRLAPLSTPRAEPLHWTCCLWPKGRHANSRRPCLLVQALLHPTPPALAPPLLHLRGPRTCPLVSRPPCAASPPLLPRPVLRSSRSPVQPLLPLPPPPLMWLPLPPPTTPVRAPPSLHPPPLLPQPPNSNRVFDAQRPPSADVSMVQ